MRIRLLLVCTQDSGGSDSLFGAILLTKVPGLDFKVRNVYALVLQWRSAVSWEFISNTRERGGITMYNWCCKRL
jgi:hypothetical protein